MISVRNDIVDIFLQYVGGLFPPFYHYLHVHADILSYH